MNRTTTIALLLIGILVFLGSCVPFGYVLYHETIVSPIDSISLSTSGTADKTSFHASPNTLARFTLEADISTSSVQEDQDSYDEKYFARFNFPITYSVSDSHDNGLLTRDTTMAWKDGMSITISNANTSSKGGTLTASTHLDKFMVPADGFVNIEIELGPDTTYEARLASPQLHLYEGMINNTWYIIVGGLMLFLGFLMSMTGFIFFVIRSAKTSSEQNQETASDKADVNQEAMIIQLSGLAGYIVPLGSLIVPLILWLIWRGKDPYLDKMGREAVNFQLSILVYYIISLVLCLLLIGFLLLFAAAIFHLAYIIIGAVQTSHGVDYRYPMIIRFLKQEKFPNSIISSEKK
ncbi:MAG: putative Tic20 family protein [Gammaproteobacteria bacterium]|jgi:uncharacterized Tic20 family protein